MIPNMTQEPPHVYIYIYGVQNGEEEYMWSISINI